MDLMSILNTSNEYGATGGAKDSADTSGQRKGITKQDIEHMLALQALQAQIFRNPQAAQMVSPAVRVALNTMMQQQAKEMLGHMIGQGNVDALYSAMQTGQFNANNPQGGGGIYGMQAYADKLADLANKVNAARKKQSESYTPPLDGEKTDPRWKQQMLGRNAPEWWGGLNANQQASLLGLPIDTGPAKKQKMGDSTTWRDPGISGLPIDRYQGKSAPDTSPRNNDYPRWMDAP